MSAKGGGAGKVYFILYLAVILELLIIIVERDEAEEALLKRQRETMQIVESILSQLQAGSGTEGINTRPQDEITIPPPGIDMRQVMGAEIKSSRKYIVEVGVTDVSAELKRREGETEKDFLERMRIAAKLANVQEIEYQIFYSPSQDPNIAPSFPTDDELRKMNIDFTKFSPGQTITAPDGSTWEFLSLRKLALDLNQVYEVISSNLNNLKVEHLEPHYPKSKVLSIGPAYAPNNNEDSIFYYTSSFPLREAGLALGNLQKRQFVINFQPPSRAGWYKLRVFSRTNRILGVLKEEGRTVEEIPEDTRINIGTVTLTVKALNKVKKELENRLIKYNLPSPDILKFAKSYEDVQKFDEELGKSIKLASTEDNAAEIISKIKLYGYIIKLLTPGQSMMFPQNANSMSFDVRVITPKPAISEPTITVAPYFAQFDAVEPVIDFTISPYQGSAANIVEGVIKDEAGSPVTRLICRGEDEFAGTVVPKPVVGGNRIYRGFAERPLSPGKYTIEIKHSLAGRTKVETTILEIFKTGLEPKSEQQLNSKLSNASFGDSLFFSVIPYSGAKIKADQFRIYLYTDQDAQKPAEIGLAIPNERALYLSCQARKLYVRITWVQPITNREVEIFPTTEYAINQLAPKINVTDRIEKKTQVGKKILVAISNIKIPEVDDGSNKASKAEISVSAGRVTVEGRLSGIVEVHSEPTIERDENSYSISFELTVNLPRGQDEISGNVTVQFSAIALNKCNGISSAKVDRKITIPISYTREKGTRRGTTPQPAPQQPRRR